MVALGMVVLGLVVLGLVQVPQQIAGSLLPLQITVPVSSEKCRKVISYECECAFHYQFFWAEAPRILISHIFLLKLLKPFFLQFKEQVHSRLSAVEVDGCQVSRPLHGLQFDYLHGQNGML
jgi:hypothetical protein